MKNILYIILFLPFFAVAQNPALQISGGGGTTINNSTTITNPAEVSPCLSGFFAVSDGNGGVNCIDTTGIFSTTGGGTDDQNLTLTGTTLEIESGNTVDLSAISGGGTNIDYSLTEQNTGKKWIDGKDIYTITLTQTPGGSLNTNFFNAPAFQTMVSMEYMMEDGGNFWSRPNTLNPGGARTGNGAGNIITVYHSENNLTNTGDKIWLHLYYTKP